MNQGQYLFGFSDPHLVVRHRWRSELKLRCLLAVQKGIECCNSKLEDHSEASNFVDNLLSGFWSLEKSFRRPVAVIKVLDEVWRFH